MHFEINIRFIIAAVYLCKRTMLNKNKVNLSDYEAENFARLQKMFTRKWEFIYMQAEAQSKVDKKREKLERKILESQERAFWDVHRPVVNVVCRTRYRTVSLCITTGDTNLYCLFASSLVASTLPK